LSCRTNMLMHWHIGMLRRSVQERWQLYPTKWAYDQPHSAPTGGLSLPAPQHTRRAAPLLRLVLWSTGKPLVLEALMTTLMVPLRVYVWLALCRQRQLSCAPIFEQNEVGVTTVRARWGTPISRRPCAPILTRRGRLSAAGSLTGIHQSDRPQPPMADTRSLSTAGFRCELGRRVSLASAR
jgi:hypothetical protein